MIRWSLQGLPRPNGCSKLALMWFEATSGLNINLEKSEILLVEVLRMLRSWLLNWAAKWGLFLPLTWAASRCSSQIGVVGDGVEERMRKRLTLWKRRSKYGEEEGGWISCEVREGYGVGLWKEIRKEGVLLFKNASFIVGDGRRVKFWKDIWCGNTPLCEAFPSLFAFAVSQDAWSRFRGESYGALACPTKVGFFAWEASWGKVLTQDHLKRRGWSLVNRCFLCCDDEETINTSLFIVPRRRCCGILCSRCLGVNWVLQLTFVYLRDNLLSTLEGVEILKRVKVLDLSFNDFKGPGFEPLENCKALQQLYLAGNQITSLISLPLLPNLEFLSVAQNKLKSLSMASQPRLQVLAASKNKISTLKGFPYLPVLEVSWYSVVGYGTNLGLSICITVYFLQREKLHRNNLVEIIVVRDQGPCFTWKAQGLLEPKDKPHFECIIGKETHGSLIDDFTKLYILIVRWDAPSIGFLAWLVKWVGNGRRVRFWKDKWCGEDTLGEAFPQLYSIAFVKDPWESNGGKKRKKTWEAAPLFSFWTPWKEGNQRAFDDSDLADQAILRVQVR
ncbi:microtubule-associated protein AIR9 [Vitis vinifera]|uniref:Microtubule-associated protein AIR9 n=1 Tax=Vitis vinifera TaxID=29760 RepID=A0A438IP61_VITVI|nr:microtubule-associated protein AIR9 [Vitis vinifera]